MSDELVDHLLGLREAIRAKEPSQALEHLLNGWQAVADSKFHDQKLLHSLLAEAFLPAPDSLGDCLLLQIAQQSGQRTKLLAQQFRKLSRLTHQTQAAYNPNETAEHWWWYRSIWLRVATVRLYLSSAGKSERLTGRIDFLLQSYRKLWSTEVWIPVSRPPSGRPATWAVLHSAAPRLAKAVDDLVQQSPAKWLDPAAVFLCNTLVLLAAPSKNLGPTEDRLNDGTGITWVLISVDDRLKQDPEPTGIVLQFKVETIPEGCGAFYPHPSLAAHIVPSRSFQEGLRNAWSVVLGRTLDSETARSCDYRWSLTVIDDSSEGVPLHRRRRLLVSSPLDGRSGEVAIACALKSAVAAEPLDLSRACTAKFRSELPNDVNPLIEPVQDVHLKSLGIAELQGEQQDSTQSLDPLQQRMARQLCQLDHLVLAKDQTIPSPLPSGLATIEKKEFDETYRELSSDALVTQAFKRKLLAQAKLFFQNECFAKPNSQNPAGAYILNPMTRPVDDRESAEGSEIDPENRKEKSIALDDSQRNAILRGELRSEPNVQAHGHRIRPLLLVADSGIGKTTLLRRIELEVAEQPGPRIPILLEGLSDYLKFDSRKTFLQEICHRHRTLLPDFGEADEDKRTERRLTWLQRKVSRGEVVFLLDALDQTSDHWRNLSPLVDYLCECPLLLTSREDALRTHSQAFGNDNRWDRVDVKPLRPRDARIYLGNWAQLFFMKVEGVDIDTDEFDEHTLDNAIDADSVLTIPLILHLLREFAQRNHTATNPADVQLRNLKNRYAVYEMVICGNGGLIDTGLKKLKDEGQHLQNIFYDRDATIDLMSQAALWQLGQHYFEKDLGPHKRKFIEIVQQVADGQPLKADLETALKQLNLVTARSMFETDGGLAWRHRSFFEFLGGRKLAEMLASGDLSLQQQACEILFQVHNVLNDDGSIRTFPVVENGKRIQQFRNLPADWQWTLRFAMAHASQPQYGADELLATELLAAGNPWVIFKAMNTDALQFSSDFKSLICCLVARNSRHWGGDDFSGAVAWDRFENTKTQATEAVRRLENTLVTNAVSRPQTFWAAMMDRRTRDAGYLFSAAELQSQLISQSDSIVIPDWTNEREQLSRSETALLNAYRDASRWVPFPDGDLEICDFPVTNEWFELFCPSHRRSRNQYSSHNDHPAIDVSWFMAKEFCRWMSAIDGRATYRLLTSAEWEAACRWGTTTKYWWDDEFNEKHHPLCWCSQTRNRSAARQRCNALQAFETAGIWHPSRAEHRQRVPGGNGLLDMSGNVWEWCEDLNVATADPSKPGSSRVLRGGSWNGYADSCCSALRDYNAPGFRNFYSGFRVCRV